MPQADLIYIEFISRNEGVGLDAFRYMVTSLQAGWEGAHESDDALLFNIGRTWRVGPEPEFLTIWRSPGGLRRLDEWEGLYRQDGQEEPWNVPFRLAGRMDAAGCYEPLLEPVAATAGRYYAEYFDFADETAPRAVGEFFAERALRFSGLELNLLVNRIGMLGPDPPGIAIWGCPSWLSVSDLAEDFAGCRSPVRPVSAALYADIGTEVR